jgi:predicted transcriptional regulator
MTVREIAKLLNADVLCCEDLVDKIEITSAFASDMMSDVLAYVKDQGVLVTGLVNPQVVRTAEMMDITCIVFVRGKRPMDSMLELAKQKNIVLLSTQDRMFPACGKMYKAGLNEGQLL